ncbi:hypothetical protein HORIV_60150 [Vreelandella olivaria]|uniref:Uncharacterized protein n=1 Tax=Vreelandella olivaria TaxID=390919 RepID=A0ABN5X2T8_9GAMM|nr:hypothetical protein HORIV_60150 [Halomonas olivaria]
MTFPLSNITWRPSYRVIPSRFPPIDLFEGVNSNPDDWNLLNELEGETSARLREEAGTIHLVRDDDRRYGPGWTPVMAAFATSLRPVRVLAMAPLASTTVHSPKLQPLPKPFTTQSALWESQTNRP